MKSLLKHTVSILFFLWAGAAYGACSVTTTSINFTAYDVFAPLPLNSTGTVTVTCDEIPPPDVTISAGPSPNSGVYNPRKMKHASLADQLNYNAFVDAAGTSIWGDGTGGTNTVFLKNVKKNKPVTTQIYGIIPPLQNVTIGTYTDALTVTIVW